MRQLKNPHKLGIFYKKKTFSNFCLFLTPTLFLFRKSGLSSFFLSPPSEIFVLQSKKAVGKSDKNHTVFLSKNKISPFLFRFSPYCVTFFTYFICKIAPKYTNSALEKYGFANRYAPFFRLSDCITHPVFRKYLLKKTGICSIFFHNMDKFELYLSDNITYFPFSVFFSAVKKDPSEPFVRKGLCSLLFMCGAGSPRE